ncbi:MAG: hypothetical protein ACXU9U_05720, partial [Parachlamydiaceae bacterium]
IDFSTLVIQITSDQFIESPVDAIPLLLPIVLSQLQRSKRDQLLRHCKNPNLSYLPEFSLGAFWFSFGKKQNFALFLKSGLFAISLQLWFSS